MSILSTLKLYKSIGECQAAYEYLSKEVFGKERRGQFRYDSRVLEDNILKVLTKAGVSGNEKLLNRGDDCCRTFVVAKADLAQDAPPVLFRSYILDGTEGSCTILQAARATSAAPTFFPAEKIDGKFYVDGGIGYNNPAEEALAEARRLWPNRDIACLISIGAGMMGHISRREFGNVWGRTVKTLAPLFAEKLTVARYCTELATSCQPVHHRLLQSESLQKKSGRPRYYRFNVPGMSGIGLQEASKLAEISQATDAYLRDPERIEIVNACVELLLSDEANMAVAG